jgi:lysophospholipase L1-like esterase
MKLFTSITLAATLALAGAQPRKPIVFLIGDSTMAERTDVDRNPERGWGQMLSRFLDGGVVVRDLAVNGRSTKSFIDEGKWDAVRAQLGRGDYLVIQFGHNDEKSEDPARFTNPYTGYRRNLERFVTEARAAGAAPIIFSPIVRRNFNEHGVLVDTHGAYPLVARDVARDMSVPFVDLQLMTEDLVLRAGPDSSKALYVWVPAGAWAKYPEGRQDDTHLTERGALAVARLAALGIRATGVGLGMHVRGVE